MPRNALSAVLLILGTVCVALGVPALYVRQELLDEPVLQARLAEASRQHDVRRVAATQVVDGLADAGVRDVLSVRPLLIPAVEAFLGTPVFRSALRTAAHEGYRTLVRDRSTTLRLDLGRDGRVLVRALRSVSPQVARRVPADVPPVLLEVDEGEPALQAIRRLAGLRALGVAAPLAGLLLLAAAVLVAPRRRAALGWAGAGIALAGGLTVLGLAVTRATTIDAARSARSASVTSAAVSPLRLIERVRRRSGT